MNEQPDNSVTQPGSLQTIIPHLKRLANGVTIAFIALLISMHGTYAYKAYAHAENWDQRVFTIEQGWQFKLLNPLIGQAIGFSLPLLSVAYVNQEAVETLGTDLDGVRRHEAKHLEQVSRLGLIRYYLLAEWKREGIAEYVRGSPTIPICNPMSNEIPARLRYREFYVVTRYLIEAHGMSEEDIYRFDEYPLEEAESWLRTSVC